MSLGHGSKTVTDGLVFYYDQENTAKSWKGKPTTNLITQIQNYASEGTYWNRIDDNQFHFRVKSTYNSWCVRAYAGAYTTGKTYTFSFEYKGDLPASGDLTLDNDGADNNIWNDTVSTSTQWQKYTRTITTTATGAWYMYFRRNGGGDIYIRRVQLEESAYSTGFVNGTRSNTQALVDLTGNSTITASSLTYNSDGSFSFDGSSDSLYITNSLSAFTNLTISTWFYLTTANGTQDIIVDRAVSLRFQLNNNKLGIHFGNGSSWVFTTDIGSTTLSANKWYNAVWTYNQNESVLYLNGNVENSYTHANGGNTGTGGIYIGQYAGGSGYNFPGKINAVSIYNRALSASEVRQNFDAVKERYFGFQDLTFITTAGTITYTNNGTKSVTFYKSGGTDNSWNTGAYCATAFTAPCTIEYTKNAASSDNSLSYAMIGWNEDPTTNSSYNTIDYAAYPYRTSTFRIYHNGSSQGDFGSGWDPNKRLYIVYDTDGYIRHYNGDILIASFNYGTGKTVYIDTGLYNINSTYGGFTDVRACQKSWNGYQYV